MLEFVKIFNEHITIINRILKFWCKWGWKNFIDYFIDFDNLSIFVIHKCLMDVEICDIKEQVPISFVSNAISNDETHGLEMIYCGLDIFVMIYFSLSESKILGCLSFF